MHKVLEGSVVQKTYSIIKTMDVMKRLELLFMGLNILHFPSMIRICVLGFKLGGTQLVEDIQYNSL